MEERIPPGLVRCKTCGDFNGTTIEKYLCHSPEELSCPLYDPEARLKVICLCHGPLCRGCGVNRIRRPISEFYSWKHNTVLHVPWFMACRLCDSCSSRQQLEAIQPQRYEPAEPSNDDPAPGSS